MGGGHLSSYRETRTAAGVMDVLLSIHTCTAGWMGSCCREQCTACSIAICTAAGTSWHPSLPQHIASGVQWQVTSDLSLVTCPAPVQPVLYCTACGAHNWSIVAI